MVQLQGQGFINLNFESARWQFLVPGVLDANPTLAFPGWRMGTSGSVRAPYTIYNGLTTGSPSQVLVDGQRNPVIRPPLEGRFSALLQFGPNEFLGTPALIQAGLVPNDARSMSFLVDDSMKNARLTMDGVEIPLFAIGGGRLAGDVSLYAGKSAELRISTAASEPSGGEWLFLDDIRFSASIVPEPAVWQLMVAGGIVCGVFLRRSRP